MGPTGQQHGGSWQRGQRVAQVAGYYPQFLVRTEGGDHWRCQVSTCSSRVLLPGLLVVVGEPSTGFLHSCRDRRVRASNYPAPKEVGRVAPPQHPKL